MDQKEDNLCGLPNVLFGWLGLMYVPALYLRHAQSQLFYATLEAIAQRGKGQVYRYPF